MTLFRGKYEFMDVVFERILHWQKSPFRTGVQFSGPCACDLAPVTQYCPLGHVNSRHSVVFKMTDNTAMHWGEKS